jgi:hypothetical protein
MALAGTDDRSRKVIVNSTPSARIAPARRTAPVQEWARTNIQEVSGTLARPKGNPASVAMPSASAKLAARFWKSSGSAQARQPGLPAPGRVT